MLLAKITKRELEVIHCLSEGMKAHEIAKHLFLSPHTINDYRRNIMNKLDAKNTANLISISFCHGLLKADEGLINTRARQAY